jgi:integrase
MTHRDLEAYRTWRTETVFKNVMEGGKSVMVRREAVSACAATVNRDHVLIMAAVNRLTSLKKIPLDVSAGLATVKLRTERKGRWKFYRAHEVERLLAAAPDHFRPVVVTALFTGARRGEVLGLRWRDVNFERGTITLFRNKTKNEEELPMPAPLVDELARLKSQRRREAKSGKERRLPTPDSPIFLSSKGMPYKDIRKAWWKTCEDAEVPRYPIHSMRHTWASNFLLRGGDVRYAQRVLGHGDLRTTLIYAHQIDEEFRSSVQAFDYLPKKPEADATCSQDMFPEPGKREEGKGCTAASA